MFPLSLLFCYGIGSTLFFGFYRSMLTYRMINPISSQSNSYRVSADIDDSESAHIVYIEFSKTTNLMERVTGIEPATNRCEICSFTIKLIPQNIWLSASQLVTIFQYTTPYSMNNYISVLCSCQPLFTIFEKNTSLLKVYRKATHVSISNIVPVPKQAPYCLLVIGRLSSSLD